MGRSRVLTRRSRPSRARTLSATSSAKPRKVVHLPPTSAITGHGRVSDPSITGAEWSRLIRPGVEASEAGKPKKTAKKRMGGGISERLLEAIERRKRERGEEGESRIAQLFKKPAGRRGRRPKNIEYGSSNGAEEDFAATDPEAERLEYDTGIRVGYSVDGDSMLFERSDDYDEELDFG